MPPTLDLDPDALLSTTRAVRKRLDLDRPVPMEVIRECIELATQAPSGSNMQGWHFVVVTDEATLRKRYDEEKARFVEPEQRLASHILVRVDAGADAAALKAAEEKAQRLAEEAKAPGADFAALAKANSEDPGSRDSGGPSMKGRSTSRMVRSPVSCT